MAEINDAPCVRSEQTMGIDSNNDETVKPGDVKVDFTDNLSSATPSIVSTNKLIPDRSEQQVITTPVLDNDGVHVLADNDDADSVVLATEEPSESTIADTDVVADADVANADLAADAALAPGVANADVKDDVINAVVENVVVKDDVNNAVVVKDDVVVDSGTPELLLPSKSGSNVSLDSLDQSIGYDDDEDEDDDDGGDPVVRIAALKMVCTVVKLSM